MSEKNNENMILSLGAIKDKFNDRLVIPDHQRPYDWKEKEWERLIMDIMTAYDDYKKGNQNSQIFLGMITLTPSKKEPGRYEVIDGQQRLTTLTVLMDVIYYRIQWNENTNTKETKHTYLKIKDLKAVRKSNIIEDDGFGNDNYTLTYNYFAGVLFNTYQLETNELKKVFSFIEKRMYFFVEFVDEIIKHNAFEKLNAAGVPLVYTDLVLNHLISMAEEEKNQTAMEIKKTWKALLETISSEQLPPDDDESENESEQAAYEESDDTSAADRGSDKTQKEKTEQLKPLKIKKFFNALHNLTLPYRESFPETVDDFIRMFDRLRKSFSPECNQTNSVFILDLMKDWSNYYLAYVSPAKSGYPDKIKQHLYYLRTIGNTSLIPAVMRTLFRLNNDKLREDRLNDEDVENIFHALVTAQMLRAVYLERENTTDTANKLRIADYIYKTIPNKTYLSLLSSLVPVELYKKAVELDSTAINKKLWNLPYCSGMSKAILAVRYDAVNKEKLFIFEKNNGPVQVEHMVALKANVNPGKYGYTYDTVNTFRNLELLEADLNKAAGDNEPEKKTDQWKTSHFRNFYTETADAVSAENTKSEMMAHQENRLIVLFDAFKEYCDLQDVKNNISVEKKPLGVVSYQKDGLLIEKVIDFKEYEKGADIISVSLIWSGDHYGYRSEPERKPDNSALEYYIYKSEEMTYRTADKLDAFKKFLEYISEERKLNVSMYEDAGINDVFTLDKKIYDAIVGFCDEKETSNLIFLNQSALDKASEENKVRICKNTVTIIWDDDTARTLYINTNNDITTACNALKELYQYLLKKCDIDPIAFIAQMTDPEMHYLKKTGNRVLTQYRNLGDEEYYEEFVWQLLNTQETLSGKSAEEIDYTSPEVPKTGLYISCEYKSFEEILGYKLHIPEYQRAYVWGQKHFDALIKSLEDGIPLGTIVLNKETDNGYSIVDGQQRITTLRGFLHAFGACALDQEDNALLASEYLSEYLKKPQSGIDVDMIKKAVFNVLVIEKAPTTFQYKVFGAINGCGKPLTLEEMVKNYLYGIIDEQSKQTSDSSITAKLKKNADTIINAGFMKAYTEMINKKHIAEDDLYDKFKEQIKSVDNINTALPHSELFGLLKGQNRKWKILDISIEDDASQKDKELMLWILMYRLLEMNTADALLLHVFHNVYMDDKEKQIHFMRRLIMLYFLLYVDDPNGNAKKSINSKLPEMINQSDPVKALEGEKLWKDLIIDHVIDNAEEKPKYIFEKLCAFDLADKTSKKIARFILLLCELWCGLPIDTAIKELKSNKPSEVEHIFPANPDEKIVELLNHKNIEPPEYLSKLENVCLLEQNINKQVGNKMLKDNKTGKIKGKLEDKDKAVYSKSKFKMPQMFYAKGGYNAELVQVTQDGSGIYVLYSKTCSEKRIKLIWDLFSDDNDKSSFKNMLSDLF